MALFNRSASEGKEEMTFIDHLEELRAHIIRSVLAILVGAIFIFIYRNWIFDNIIVGPINKDFMELVDAGVIVSSTDQAAPRLTNPRPTAAASTTATSDEELYYNPRGRRAGAGSMFTSRELDSLGISGQEEMSDDEVTLDYVLDRLVIHGDASSVADQVLAFREEVGDFGHLVYAGHDWTDYELGRKSMILTAEKVMPIINDAIKS